MTFGKDFNAEQRAAFDAMAAERGSGMDASLLNQDRSSGNVDGTDYYNAIRDEAIKPNNILNGYLGIQEIPNLMANGSSTRGSRGNNNLSSETLTDAEFEKGRNKFIDLMTPYSDTNMRNGFTYTADDDSGSFVESDIPSNMMSNGSNSGRGVDTSLSNTIGRDVASGMGDGLNNVMRMTENIQSKYGDPNDKTVDEIMAQYNADNEYNRITNSGMSKAQADKILADSQLPFRDKGGSGFLSSLDPIDFAFRMAAGGDTTQNSIDAHRANKNSNFGDGLMGYKDENMLNQDGTTYTPVSDMPNGYHFKSGKDAGKIARGDMTMGGLPMGLFGHIYQQGTGLIKGDGSFGKGAYLQAVDNARGLAASGNAPALQGIFDRIAEGRAREGVMNQRIADGTFVPGKKAQAYEDKPVAVVKPKVKVDYNKNTPAPTQKKQGRAGASAVKAPTRTTGSRGGRGNVGAKKAVAKKSVAKKSTPTQRIGGRYGL